MSYKSGFYKGRLGIGLANNGGDGTGNPRFPLDVNGDIRLTGSLLRSDGTPYLGGGLINYIPKGIKSIVNNDGGYFVGFGTHTPTEALDISGNLKVSGQILSVDGDNFSTVVPITQQQTTTENPTWHGDVTTTVTSSSDSASGLALKANIATPTFTSNLKIEQTGTNNNTLIINANNHNNGIDIEAFQSDSTSTKKKLCLNPYGGNVGIGTTTPGAKLNIKTPGSGTRDAPNNATGKALSIDDGNNGLYLNIGTSSNGTTAAFGLNWYNSGSHTDVDNVLVLKNVDGENRVGIGTTSPQSGLDIHKSHPQTGLMESDGITFSTEADGSPNWGLGYIGGYHKANNGSANGYPGGIIFKTKPANSTADYNFNDSMVIDSVGNVGIGTTNPLEKLHISGSGNVNLKIVSTNTSSPGIELIRTSLNNSTHHDSSIFADDAWTDWKIYNNGSKLQFQGGYRVATSGSHLSTSPQTLVTAMTMLNNGNVGIGTTSPTQVLDVKFPNATSGSDPLFIQATRSGLAYAGVGFRAGDGTWHAFWEHTHGDPDRMNFGMYRAGDGKQVYMTLTHQGRLGIGTTSPYSKLSIGGITDSDFANGKGLIACFEEGSTGNYFYGIGVGGGSNLNTQAGLAFWGGSEGANPSNSNCHLIINRSGNVGIGTTSPQTMLDVRGEGGGSNGGNCLTLRNGNSNNDFTGSQILFTWNGNPYNSLGYSHKIQSRHNSHTPHNNNAIDFYLWKNGQGSGDIGNTHGMSITAEGVGIGTTSPQSSLHIREDSDHHHVCRMDSLHGSSYFQTIFFYGGHHIDVYKSSSTINGGSGSSGTNMNLQYYSDGHMNLCHGGGTCTIYNYSAGSDARIKHNEKNIEQALETIRKLKGQYYIKTPKLYDENHHFILNEKGEPIDIPEGDKYIYEYGFIAQDVEKIPELKLLVSEPLDKDKDDDWKSLKYNDIFVLNVAATQELDKKVTTLETENQELKTKNSELENKVSTLESELAAIKAHLGI